MNFLWAYQPSSEQQQCYLLYKRVDFIEIFTKKYKYVGSVMRFFYVGNGNNMNVHVGPKSRFAFQSLGFSPFIMASTGNLRFRSLKVDGVQSVCLYHGELDLEDHIIEQQLADGMMIFIIVGSDEGYSETTLLRIAALISSVTMFLSIAPSPTFTRNAAVLNLVLKHIDHRLELHDFAFLTQSTEAMLNKAIVATGLGGQEDFLSELVAVGQQHTEPGTRAPGYVCVTLGQKLLAETNADWLEESSECNSVSVFTPYTSDKYIVQLITAAFFSVPFATSSNVLSSGEEKMVGCELVLQRLSIDRGNVWERRSAAVVKSYTAHLRKDFGGQKPVEEHLAFQIEDAFNRLRELTFEADPWGVKFASPIKKNTSAQHDTQIDVDRRMRDHYHLEDVDFDWLSSTIFTLEDLTFYSGDSYGKMQLMWVSFEQHGRGNSSFGTVSGGFSSMMGSERPHQQNGDASSSILREETMSDDPVAGACPKGYGIGIVYLPLADEDGDGSGVTQLDQMPVWDEANLSDFGEDVLGSLETQYCQMNWLLTPSVESYSIPGLLCFTSIDRASNTAVSASITSLLHDATPETRMGVADMTAIFCQCVSQAHEYVAMGFSEGLWGHLGIQFFYAVGPFSTIGTGGYSSLAGSPSPPRDGAQASERSRAGRSANLSGFLQGRNDAKISPELVPILSVRPFHLADEGRALGGRDQHRLVETYCLFLGVLTPDEVCNAVTALRDRIYAR